MKQNNKASGLVFAIVLLFVILGMVITLSSITILETKMSQKTKSSVGAFYNSESGVEWALNKIATSSGPNISNVFGASFSGGKVDCPSGFNCEIYLLDQSNQIIASDTTLDQVKAVRSVGTQTAGEPTQRAIEAAVAGGGNACFTYYCGGSGATHPCSNSGMPQGHCPSGFRELYDEGDWGICTGSIGQGYIYSRPPGGGCISGFVTGGPVGNAYLCCQ